MLKKIYSTLVLAMLILPAFTQSGAGTLKGTITDEETGELLPFVNVVVSLNGNQVTGGTTDFDGKYTVKPIDPGTYDVLFSFVGYNSRQVNGVVVQSNKITFQDIKLGSGIELAEVEIIEYRTPLIDKDGGASGGAVSREDINKMPGRSATSIATTVAGVSTAGTENGEVSIRGARGNSTWIYIDGIKVRGSSALPKSAIEEVSVMTGGIPANIGDATGGVINISLRSSSAKFFGGIELVSSGFKSGEDVIGLDKFGYNLIEGSLSGPLLFKKDENGEKERPILGFFLSGNYNSTVDNRPTIEGVYRIKDESLQSLLDEPLILTDAGSTLGARYRADFLTGDDFEKSPTRLNNLRQNANLVAKVDVHTSDTQSLTFGGTVAYEKSNDWNRENSLMNWENNQESTDFDWRVYGKFSQRFKNSEEESSASTLKNVYYTVMVDYTRINRLEQDAGHKDDFFKYGHVGKFDIYGQNTYEGYMPDPDNNPGIFRQRQNGFQDTLVIFTPSEHNPNLAAINNQYFGLFDVLPNSYYEDLVNQGVTDVFNPYESLLAVQSGLGIRNGDAPYQIYSMWNTPGTQSNRYSIREENQFRVSASGSADIGNHAVQLGFEYEQRKDSRFTTNPRGLWTLARLTTNFHIKEFDYDAGSINEYNIGNDIYEDYARLIGDDQSEFDYNLRNALGLDPNGNDIINTDALDPETFSLDMFGADDLFNQGNSYVYYYGYDPYGNKQNKRPSLEDFFNETNENGYRTRPIGAYEPIYMSGYLMDKFAFDDVIFNVGLRVDRFDANQKVLKDPYVMGEGISAGEVTSLGDNSVSHPSNIGDDFVVYIDDANNPTSITGYRDGDVWYDSSGSVVEDPTNAVASNSGQIIPLTVGGSDAELTSDAFEDYKPDVNLMPRIAFSFPISDEAIFFAHYDVLTQRPTSNNIFNPIDYLFIENQNDRINNPNLKPSKTTDYELGFQQVLSKTSSFKISAFYRELKDMIQVRSFIGGYPSYYTTFDNIDFGTVKGLTLAYDLRRTGNIWMKVSYTLQFADATGSTSETALALINAGVPNLRSVTPVNNDQRHRINATIDYRYGGGKDYNGPVVFDKQILANTGVNFIANLGSGTPYTAASEPRSVVTGGARPIEGTVNGSRLPWTFTLDANLDKNIALKVGGDDGDKAKTLNLNVFLWVTNVLNTQNIIGVHRFTGTPDDDGYLAYAQFQNEIENQNSAEAFRNYYSMRVDDPYNFMRPRTIRLGLRLDF